MEETRIIRICGLAVLLSQGPAYGQSFLLAKETFDSYTAGSISGQGVAGEGWTGGWTGDRERISVTTSASPLTYQIPNRGTLSSGNGCLELTTAPEPITGTTKAVSRSFTPVQADVFISFVFQMSSIGSGTDKFFADVLDDSGAILITLEFTPSLDTDFPAFHWSANTGLRRSGVLPDGNSSTRYLALFEIRRKPTGNSTFYQSDYWINPDEYSPRSAAGAFGNNENSVSTIRLRIASSDNAGPHTTVRIDNLRVGLTWDSAVPPLPPGTTFPNFAFEDASRITWFASSRFQYRVESSNNGQSWAPLSSFERGNNALREFYVPQSQPVELLRVARRAFP